MSGHRETAVCGAPPDDLGPVRCDRARHCPCRCAPGAIRRRTRREDGAGSKLDRRRPARRDDEPSGAVHRIRRHGTRRPAGHRVRRCTGQLHVQPRHPVADGCRSTGAHQRAGPPRPRVVHRLRTAADRCRRRRTCRRSPTSGHRMDRRLFSVLIALYLVAMRAIFTHEQHRRARETQEVAEEPPISGKSRCARRSCTTLSPLWRSSPPRCGSRNLERNSPNEPASDKHSSGVFSSRSPRRCPK